MDFVGIIMFVALYYIRPQDWLPASEPLRLVSISIYFSLFAMFFRSRGFQWKELVKTPHDYAMLAFFIYIIYAGASWRDEFEKVKPHFLFYFLIVQALHSTERLEKYLAWVTGLMVLIAGLAVASEYGFDIANSYEQTHGIFKGRLAFHNAIYNNPNGLGHGVVPAVGMIYFFCFWKRPIFVKEVGLALLALTLWCVFLTESKGAFLSGFAAVVTTLCFGRPKIYQILVLVVALTVGMAGLKALPRMNDMNAPRQDAGIRGRLDAFRWGLAQMEQHRNGIGLFQFASLYQKETGLFLSPHSSYVGMGAELGRMGMFFYLAVFYCSIKVLVTAKTTTPGEERARRVLMVLNVSFMVSTWMINWGHQANYWFMAAVTAAFHRHLLAKDEALASEGKELAVAAEGSSSGEVTEQAVPVMAVTAVGPDGTAMAVVPAGTLALPEPKGKFAEILAHREKLTEKPKPKSTTWKRIGLIDLGIIWLLTHYVIEFWKYIVIHL